MEIRSHGDARTNVLIRPTRPIDNARQFHTMENTSPHLISGGLRETRYNRQDCSGSVPLIVPSSNFGIHGESHTVSTLMPPEE